MTTAPAARVAPFTLASLALAELAGAYSILVMPFILAAMMEGVRLSEAVAGRFVSLELLGMMLGSAVVTLGLRSGRSLRSTLAIGAAVIVLANVVCTLHVTPLVAGIARFVAGTGEGAAMAAAAAAVCATVNPHRVYSVIGMVSAVVAIVCLVVTPFLSSRFGPAGVFWSLAVVPVPLLLVLRGIPPAAEPAAATAATALGSIRHGAPMLLAYLAFWAGSAGMWVYAERIGAAQGLTPAQIGYWLSLGQFAGIPGPFAAAWAGPRIGMRASIFLGCVGMGAAIVSFVFGGHGWTYGLGGFLASFWLMFVVPCFRSRMAGLDPSGRTVALSVGVYTVGFGMAPLVVSAVTTEGEGYAATGIFCLVCFLASAVLASVQPSVEPERALTNLS